MSVQVSFLVPIYNEGASVRSMLRSIFGQQFSKEALEVVIALAPSSDDTEQQLRDFSREHPTLRIEVVPNPDRNTAVGRNLCLAHASGEFVMNFSGHAIADPDLVPVLLAKLEKLPNDVAGVGCRISAAENPTWMGRAITAVMESPLGGSRCVDSHYRATCEGPARSVAFILYRKDRLTQIDGFDTDFWCGQDAELNLRLARAGARLWYTPETGVRHRKRTRFREFIGQLYQYGVARARLTKKYPESLRGVLILPALFLLLLLVTAIGAAFHSAVAWFLIAAGGLFTLAAVITTRLAGGSLVVALVSPLLYGLLYICYGSGFLRGLFKT